MQSGYKSQAVALMLEVTAASLCKEISGFAVAQLVVVGPQELGVHHLACALLHEGGPAMLLEAHAALPSVRLLLSLGSAEHLAARSAQQPTVQMSYR